MTPLAIFQNLNTPEIILIFLVVLLLFGAKRLPELFRSFGKSIREFKKATSEIEGDIRTAMEEEPAKPAAKVEPAPKAEPAAATPAKPTEVVEETTTPKSEA